MWQALRSELHPKGLEIVTVALDVDAKAPLQWIERARPEHPSLLDSTHLVDELFGMVNVPNAVWIDEQGIVVRPAEPAAPSRPVDRARRPPADRQQSRELPPDTPEYLREVLAEARKIRLDRDAYTAALRDWVDKGAESRFALAPDEVIQRSGVRERAEAMAAAEFELGQHLWQQGRPELAPRHWREAHRLQPDNWTYKRQAWVLANPLQGPTDLYDSDWLSDTRKIGAENYYPPLEL